MTIIGIVDVFCPICQRTRRHLKIRMNGNTDYLCAGHLEEEYNVELFPQLQQSFPFFEDGGGI